jgi:hypothetical protein
VKLEPSSSITFEDIESYICHNLVKITACVVLSHRVIFRIVYTSAYFVIQLSKVVFVQNFPSCVDISALLIVWGVCVCVYTSYTQL